MCKIFSISAMILSLAFLTGLNYLIYPATAKPITTNQVATVSNKSNASIPVEERAPEASNPSVAEEFIHGTHTVLELININDRYLHRLFEAGQLQLIHYELLSPPPERV